MKATYRHRKPFVGELLKNKILVNVFYEPSTRTNYSFQCAMMRLGGKVMTLSLKDSSVEKGESFEDTIRTMGVYGDAMVLRHPAVGSSLRASEFTNIPVINAGDGNGEHPTQALLDLVTIHFELLERNMTMDNICVGFIGDPKNSRTIHSLLYLLKFYNITVLAYCPDTLVYRDPSIRYCDSLEEIMRNVDVLYVTRIQKERFTDEKEYDDIISNFRYHITKDNIETMKPSAIIMHPLPRKGEISSDVDNNPRCVYFNQMENGVYVRMTLLNLLLHPRFSEKVSLLDKLQLNNSSYLI
jgi:aspartate carbamoyltransferase